MSKILLLGDAITAKMPNSLIGTENDEIINAGINDVGIGVYQQFILPKLSNINPDIMVVLIGLKNILNPVCESNEPESLDEIIKKMFNFIYELNRENSKIIIQSVYPTRDLEINKKIQQFNEKISELCYQIAIEYLDIYDLLLDQDNLLMEKYTDDGIHPNINGYTLIANQINELFLMYDNSYFR